jgi:hypothetical protein
MESSGRARPFGRILDELICGHLKFKKHMWVKRLVAITLSIFTIAIVVFFAMAFLP